MADNPAHLSPADLELVASWRYRRAGAFFIERHLKKYTVFLSGTSPAQAYGVLGLVSPIEEVVGPFLPVYVDAVLLPFDGRIIYDSLLIPAFGDEAEEAAYWATHTFGDGLLKQMRPARVVDPRLPPPRAASSSVTIRLDADVLHRLRTLAAARGIGY